MRKFKNILSILLIATMILPLVPIGEVRAFAADGTVVEVIEILRTMEEFKSKGEYTIKIRGQNLNKAKILYREGGTAADIEMPALLPGSGNELKQYAMDPNVIVTHITVAGKEYRMLEDEMPEIESITANINGQMVDTKQFDLNGEDIEEVVVKGKHFDKVGTHTINEVETITKMSIDNKSVNDDFVGGSPVTLGREKLMDYGTGRKNVITERESIGPGVKMKISYLQNNIIRIYEGINIDIGNEVTIYPNRGKVGSPVEVTIKNKKEQYSVFFKEKDEDFYKVKIMGEGHEYPLVTDGKTIIRLKVPKGVETGKMYKLYITNNLSKQSKGKDGEYDLTPLVTKEQYIGEFYVVDSKIGPEIEKVVEKEGSSDGSYLDIYGKRLEELRIAGLKIEKNEVTKDDLSVLDDGLNTPTKLQIKYNIGDNPKYNDKEVKQITRDFLVTIGRDAIFEPEEEFIKKHKFQDGDDKEDTLHVKTNTMSQEDLKDPVKDVIVLITTIITMESGEVYKFTEFAIKEKGYTYLVSSQDPIINNVTPNKIQLKNTDTTTKNDTIVSIQGERFNVFRYKEGNTTKTSYPKIVIGGVNESDAELIIEKTSDGTVKYYRKDNSELTLLEESKENILFEVLDKSGNIVDGVGKNEEGTSIVLTIPKGVLIGQEVIGTPLPIAIANPKRDTKDRRPYNHKNDMISFIKADTSPTIESVEPWRVTTVGGEEIVVTGNGFMDGIKVFIHGIEVNGVKREIDKLTTKGKLTFKAPKRAEGRTVIMIQNPDGGSDIHEFIYVQTENIDPKLTKIIPDKGTEDDIIILRGDNFLKPDPTIKNLSGIGIDKLIGTTVKIGGIDVNEYNPGKKLIPYSAPEEINEDLIFKQENALLKIQELKLGKGYKNSIIKSGDKIYTIRKNKEGTMDIAGDNNIYTFYLEDSDIKAKDLNGVEYTATITKDRIILKSSTMEKVFDISYNFDVFSITEDERGSRTLRLADYYKSIYLKDTSNDKYFIITKDEKGRVVLTDGKDENYEVKIVGNEIHAGNYKVTVEKNHIAFDGRTINFETPYKQEGNIIIGHRVEILDKGEIEVRVPKKDIPTKYDVTVTNPDTKSATIKQGFLYIGSADHPEIYFISPPEGSIEGGYIITIGGARFDKDTQVLIDGIPGTNIVVDQTTYRSLKVKVPKYRGTEADFVSQKKFVRVHVITRTGQASTKNMFAYKLTSSKPSIKILDTKGSTAGGKIIRLVGKDIRFYEPYTGNPPSPASIPGVDYEDLDENKKWTNIISDKDSDAKPLPLIPKTPDYDKYLSSIVLPVITFGNHQAKIVEFTKNGDEYMIQVVLPESDITGPVDVILSNNDRAQSNIVKFNYESSKPTIKTITPPDGRRSGGEKRDIEATGYIPSKIKIIGANGKETETTMNMVRFGENSNKGVNIDDANAGGRIRNGNATVHLTDSKLKVELKNEQISLTLTEDQDYIGTFPFDQGTKYINSSSLKGRDNNASYKGSELIKVSIKPEGKLEVERGFSPSVKVRTEGILETIVPSYYKTGNVDVVLANKDGESNKVKFQYTNPDSQPKVTNILRDGIEPKIAGDGKEKIQQIPAKGGSFIKVIGSGFRNNPSPTIIMGANEIVIPSSEVSFISDKELSFIMPGGKENLAGKLLNLIVQNDDKGTGQSKDNNPPLYVQIITGDTNPTTGNIDPDHGPVSGGTQVTIKGTDFRQKVDGYDGEFEIFFGENKVNKEDIISITHDKIVLKTPKSHKPGRVPVKIVNPDGTPTDNNIFFTYISEPKILDVSPKSLFINDDKSEITIIGESFMEGAKVTINGKDALEVKFIDEKTLKVKFPKTDKAEKVVIQVINPDGGKSNEYSDFRYELPLPLKPMVLEGIPGYESTVMLIWNKSDPDILNKASNYEIYGRKTADKANTFVGTTDNADFLVKGLEANTEYEFLVRALNEHGSAIDFATVIVKTLSGQEDYKQKEKEEKLKEEQKNLDLKGKETIAGNKVNKTLGREDIKNGLGIIDFTLSKYKNATEYTIIIPIALARTDSTLTIKDSTLNMVVNPKDLYTYKVSSMDEGDKDSTLQIIIKKGRETNIPRGQKVASLTYDIDFIFQRTKEKINIDKLLRSGKLSLNLDSLTYAATKNVYLAKFNIQNGIYEKVGTDKTTSFNEKGKYLLLSDR